MKFINTYHSPLGEIIMASNGKELTGLWFKGQKYFNNKLLEEKQMFNLPIFKKTKEWLDIYFSGKKPDFIPTINIENASNFRKQVWQILLKIPYGKTITYGEISKQIEQETENKVSAQAVGGAVGHNPISIIVPCHRVVGFNGNLTGYAGGIDRKIKLLKIEKVNLKNLFIPKIGTAI